MRYKGQIAGFPAEVVDKMLERQLKQAGKRDVSVFEKKNTEDSIGGGFDWERTEEGFNFWNVVITMHEFGVFFDRYPNTKPELEKQSAKHTPEPWFVAKGADGYHYIVDGSGFAIADGLFEADANYIVERMNAMSGIKTESIIEFAGKSANNFKVTES